MTRVDLRTLPAGHVCCVAHELTAIHDGGAARRYVSAPLSLRWAARPAIPPFWPGLWRCPAVLSVPGADGARCRTAHWVIVDGTARTGVPQPRMSAPAATYRAAPAGLRQQRRASLKVYRDRATVNCRRRASVAALCQHRQPPDGGSAAPPTMGLRASACSAPSSCSWTAPARPRRDEQLEAYRQAAAGCMAGKEVIIRTLDVGGDKADLTICGMAKEENPFLGSPGHPLLPGQAGAVQDRSCARCCGRVRDAPEHQDHAAAGDRGWTRFALPAPLLEQCKQELEAEGTCTLMPTSRWA